MLRSTILLCALASLAGCGHPQPEARTSPLTPDSSARLEAERMRGAADARARIEGGSFALLVPSAPPVSWMHQIRVAEYARFGIDYELTGDHYDPAFEAYRAGFNEVMVDALKRRHGEDVLDRINEAIDRRLREEAPDSSASAG